MPEREITGGLPSAEAKEFTAASSHVVKTIVAEMQLEPRVAGWLDAGSDRLFACVDEFTTDLGKHAVRTARANKRTAIDAQDVTEANGQLLKIGSERRAYWLAVGGLGGGGAIAGALSIGLSDHVAAAWRWWLVVACLFIVAITGFYLGKPNS